MYVVFTDSTQKTRMNDFWCDARDDLCNFFVCNKIAVTFSKTHGKVMTNKLKLTNFHS
jgi:hypothetical protein